MFIKKDLFMTPHSFSIAFPKDKEQQHLIAQLQL